jgi:hypothetical protein
MLKELIFIAIMQKDTSQRDSKNYLFELKKKPDELSKEQHTIIKPKRGIPPTIKNQPEFVNLKYKTALGFRIKILQF